ncbi:hypothetical protein D3C81_428140 [compost metagenome]
MNSAMEQLQEKRKEIQKQLREIDNEIYNLKRSCQHESINTGNSYEIDQVVDDDRDYEEIRERMVTCTECGHNWHEQRCADEDWPSDKGERN